MSPEAFSSLPQIVQEKRKREDEVTKLSSVLWEKCVNIVSEHGSVDGDSSFFGMVKNAILLPAFVGVGIDIKPSEMFGYWVVEKMVPIDNGEFLNVQIFSLGNSRPEEAKHIIINVPELSELSLMIDKNGRPEMRMITKIGLRIPGRPVLHQMREYSQAVNLLGAHLKITS